MSNWFQDRGHSGQRDSSGADQLLAAERERDASSGSSKFHMDFTVGVAQSSIGSSEAGQGVHLAGKAPMGSVVAMYPGLVAVPENHADVYHEMINRSVRPDETGNPFVVARIDNIIIDARYTD
jgi:hypothetical protein